MFIELVDAFRDLLPTFDGVTKDDTASQPTKALPGRLYVWPNRLGPQNPADQPEGRVRDPMLRLSVLITQAAKGETRTIARTREISRGLDASLEAILTAIYDNRRTVLWWDAYHESIVFDAVRNETARGHGVNVVLRVSDPIGG